MPSARAQVDVRGVEPRDVPLALADTHQAHDVDASLTLLLPHLDEITVDDLVVGAGFEMVTRPRRTADDGARVAVRRLRTLADTVAPDLQLLLVGLNPSIYSADAGFGFARPGNRFWPAAHAAGVITRPGDPRHALLVDRVGMTDLVKRPTARADELHPDEYRAGVARIERLAAWLRPRAICLVGLAGWRAAVDRRAATGWQEATLGPTPVYVMPSTSGLNARTPAAELAEHLRRARAGRPPLA